MIAVIGIGAMGGRIATRLHDAGHEVVGRRRDAALPARKDAEPIASAAPGFDLRLVEATRSRFADAADLDADGPGMID